MKINSLDQMDVEALRSLIVSATMRLEESNLVGVDHMVIKSEYAIRQLVLIESCVSELLGRAWK